MVDRDESDPVAEQEVLEIVGSDVIDSLARAARDNNVIINVNIMPNRVDADADDNA